MIQDPRIQNAYISNFFFFFFDEGNVPSEEEMHSSRLDEITKKILYSFDTNNNVFITGKAGTGKTTLLKQILKHNKITDNKNIVVVAPTGVAAENADGYTIHSFLKMPTTLYLSGYRHNRLFQLNQKQIQFVRHLDTLIIDEISMVRCDMLDAIDAILRHYRKSTEAFGGVQIIMVGDLYQLPPVTKPKDWKLLKRKYSLQYFFGSKVFNKFTFTPIELQKVWRQTDDNYVNILNKIRIGKVDDDELSLINEQYDSQYQINAQSNAIILTAKKNSANNQNKKYYEELSTEEEVFYAEVYNWRNEDEPADRKLKLKIGARVMFIRNTNDYKNGTMGRVIEISQNHIIVKKDDGDEVDVHQAIWNRLELYINDATKQIETREVGSFKQYPLKLAWAISIHKSQGLTFEEIAIDAADSFTFGQIYVALSRCKTLSGVHLLSKITKNTIMVDDSVTTFLNSLTYY